MSAADLDQVAVAGDDLRLRDGGSDAPATTVDHADLARLASDLLD